MVLGNGAKRQMMQSVPLYPQRDGLAIKHTCNISNQRIIHYVHIHSFFSHILVGLCSLL